MSEKYRIEHDSMGEVSVPADRTWGAQTQRSLDNFRIGSDRMPPSLIRAIIMIKEAAAEANHRLIPERMTEGKKLAITGACEKLLSDFPEDEFPLSVWQTGSGTQTNMNVNEVIAHVGNAAAGDGLLHPNDDVNMSQSTNDVFPSAIQLAYLLLAEKRLLPALGRLSGAFSRLEDKYAGTVKCGRTHLMDAVPVTFGQEAGGWRSTVDFDAELIERSLPPLRRIPLGGTAVGTGLNAPRGFDGEVCRELSRISGTGVLPAPDKFHSLSAKSEIAAAHSALNVLASDLIKICNDIRWMSSGPRCGLSEIRIPENEPGSSIMPGKVNPTQCEAAIMVCMHVAGNNLAIANAASSGNFELNVAMPLIGWSAIRSVCLLSDAVDSLTEKCVGGITADADKMKRTFESSVMNITALSPLIGYEKAAECAKRARTEGITLKEAVLRGGLLSPEEFDSAVDWRKMV